MKSTVRRAESRHEQKENRERKAKIRNMKAARVLQALKKRCSLTGAASISLYFTWGHPRGRRSRFPRLYSRLPDSLSLAFPMVAFPFSGGHVTRKIGKKFKRLLRSCARQSCLGPPVSLFPASSGTKFPGTLPCFFLVGFSV